MPTQFVSPKFLLSVLTLVFAASYVVRAQSFTDAEKTVFVVTHNRLREAAFPSAEGMRFVIWNATLERLAIAAANRCDYEHTYGGEYEGLGENIYKGFRTNPHEITLGWYSEKSAYNADLTSCTGCGHYTQVMTAAVTQIGCGIKRDCKPNEHMVYCEYNAGNGYFVRGPACSACPAATPLCLNGLCISKDMATNPVMKEVDSTVATAADFKCRLYCKNCGKFITDTSTNVCQCDCSATGATGNVCESKPASSTVKCTPCATGTLSPPCLNSGTEDASDPLKCKCKCPAGFLGDKCEIPKEQFDNSVKLVLAAASEFKFAKWVIMPPVSRSLFNSKIWAALQPELAKTVNSFCRVDAVNFGKCCPGKTFPTSSIAAAEHVKATDFRVIESTIGNTFDGSLNMLVFATVSSSSQLCPPTASPAYLPQLALLPAIQSALTVISAQMVVCCGDLVLKEAKASGDLGALTPPKKSSTVRLPAPGVQWLWLLVILWIMIWQ